MRVCAGQRRGLARGRLPCAVASKLRPEDAMRGGSTVVCWALAHNLTRNSSNLHTRPHTRSHLPRTPTGLVVTADATSDLERGHWPSYNIPYFPQVGQQQQQQQWQ